MLFLHDQTLREYGGAQGVRDHALLDSALARPANKLAYAEPDLFDLAAAYACGLSRNHAFVDGNKRTAWSCCVLFLKANGVELSIPAAHAVEQVVQLATGSIGETDLASWLRDHRRT